MGKKKSVPVKPGKAKKQRKEKEDEAYYTLSFSMKVGRALCSGVRKNLQRMRFELQGGRLDTTVEWEESTGWLSRDFYVTLKKVTEEGKEYLEGWLDHHRRVGSS